VAKIIKKSVHATNSLYNQQNFFICGFLRGFFIIFKLYGGIVKRESVPFFAQSRTNRMHLCHLKQEEYPPEK